MYICFEFCIPVYDNLSSNSWKVYNAIQVKQVMFSLSLWRLTIGTSVRTKFTEVLLRKMLRYIIIGVYFPRKLFIYNCLTWNCF